MSIKSWVGRGNDKMGLKRNKMSKFLHTLNSQELEKCFDKIRDTIESQDTRIKYLEKKNEELLDTAYKDNKLKEMQDKLNRMQEDYRRGFPITVAEEKAIEKWHKEHDAKVHGLKTDQDRMRAQGCCGGALTYCFIPTSLGVLGYVQCHCGEEFTFSDL